MTDNPEIAATRAQIEANNRLAAEVEQKLEQIGEIMSEFQRLFAQHLGIAPAEVENHLRQHLSPEEFAQLQSQFEAETGSAHLSEAASSQATSAPRRVGLRRNIV